jgi:hypothetical protein
MFTSKQSIKVKRFSVVSTTTAFIVAVVYSLIFGNPGIAMWASIFSLPALVLVAFFSGLVSSRVTRSVGTSFMSPVIGIAVGILLCAILETAVYLLCLRMIQELYDNMHVEEIESVLTYALVSFLEFGIPAAVILFLIMGIVVLILKAREHQSVLNKSGEE